ncbi:hypothetical protein [Streptomyces sp. GC420]|uniref:hypothetical protein n=1 Tax=Streptomyces sp. GC420 TaxID=2697568 RepID=UPI00141502A1|nr:hypothetical protein [Streptomyces sp. GC420]
MSVPDHGEAEVRRLLDGPHPAVPPDLGRAAAERGERLLRGRRLRRRLTWLLLFAAFVALVVWTSVNDPWAEDPIDTTPPLVGW